MAWLLQHSADDPGSDRPVDKIECRVCGGLADVGSGHCDECDAEIGGG